MASRLRLFAKRFLIGDTTATPLLWSTGTQGVNSYPLLGSAVSGEATYKDWLSRTLHAVADSTDSTCFRLDAHLNSNYSIDVDASAANKLVFRNNWGLGASTGHGYLCFGYESATKLLRAIKRYTYNSSTYAHTLDSSFAPRYVKYANGEASLVDSLGQATQLALFGSPINFDMPTDLNPSNIAASSNSSIPFQISVNNTTPTVGCVLRPGFFGLFWQSVTVPRRRAGCRAAFRERTMDMQLKGKTALVTGASVGIGAAIAKALAAEGVRVAISARRVDKLRDTAAAITAAGGPEPVVLESDLYAADAASSLAARAVAALGSVDILVNNAGGSRSFSSLHVTEAQWTEAMTLNFDRPRQLADALIDQMIARNWGRIINITGKSEPDHVNGAFCAKAAVHSWAKGLSRMVGKNGITVNCIPPGRIHSEQIFRNYSPEYRKWQSENEIPVGRYGEPEELAALAVFLASPLAGYISGTVIPVDGGLRRYQF